MRFSGSSPPSGFEAELEERCDWGDRWTVLDATSEADRHRVLGGSLARLTPPVPARHLLTRPDFGGRIVWVKGVEPSSWPAWRNLLVRYSDARRNLNNAQPPSVFVVPLCGPAFEQAKLTDVWIRYHEFRDVVHRDDLLAYALQRVNSPPEYRLLLASTVAHVSQWDLQLAERLIGAKPEHILDPRGVLESDAATRGWSERTQETWESGTVDGQPSRPRVHASLLHVKRKAAELNRRLWAAQVSVLLPMVGDRQAEIVQEFGPEFLLPLDLSKDNGNPAPISSLERVELRHVVNYRVELRAPSAAVQRARPLHKLRNELAHYKPLDLTTDRGERFKLLSGRS